MNISPRTPSGSTWEGHGFSRTISAKQRPALATEEAEIIVVK